MAARAELRALGREPRRARIRRVPARWYRLQRRRRRRRPRPRHRPRSWAEIVDGKTIALRWRPGVVQIGGEPTIAVSRGPYILQRMRDGAPVFSVGMYQTVWVRDAKDGVWRVLFDGSATTSQPMATVPRPTAGSRSRRCPTARPSRRAPARAGLSLDHAALEHAAVGGRATSRAAVRPRGSSRRSRDRARRSRGRATSRCAATWPPALARRLRRRPAAGRCARRRRTGSTALASARCSSTACRSMLAVSRARSALPSAARRASTADRRASSSGGCPAGASSASISPAPWTGAPARWRSACRRSLRG